MSRGCWGRAGQLYAADPDATRRLQHVHARLEAPLRVAIAGKVKAGKSTLLNALVGERLAPTDEGECTKVVTWYQDGHTYQVLAYPRGIEPQQLRFRREDHHLEVDLAGQDPLDLERIEVTWPSASLRAATLIDTPGIGSLSTRVAQQTTRFLAPEDDVTQADAVLYLMKHLHANDLAFLEAFHDTEVAQPNPVNAIAVLSRADEIGVGRLDSMGSANRIANRYKHDPNVRRLAQTVVPMAGLLAETATTLTEDEFRMVRTLAGAAAKDIDDMLLSADRFVNSPSHTGLTDLERHHLLNRLGVFGIRLSTTLARRNAVTTASDLSAELEERSGLNDLKAILSSLFEARSELLKSRSALLALDDLLRNEPVPGAEQLSLEVERVMASAHPFTELAGVERGPGRLGAGQARAAGRARAPHRRRWHRAPHPARPARRRRPLGPARRGTRGPVALATPGREPPHPPRTVGGEPGGHPQLRGDPRRGRRPRRQLSRPKTASGRPVSQPTSCTHPPPPPTLCNTCRSPTRRAQTSAVCTTSAATRSRQLPAPTHPHHQLCATRVAHRHAVHKVRAGQGRAGRGWGGVAGVGAGG